MLSTQTLQPFRLTSGQCTSPSHSLFQCLRPLSAMATLSESEDEMQDTRGKRKGEDEEEGKGRRAKARIKKSQGQDDEEEGELQRGRLSASRQSRTRGPAMEVNKALRELKALMSMTIISLLQQQLKMREVEAVVFTAFEAPVEDPLIEAMTKQGQLCSKKVSEEGKGLDLGPPHL